MIKTHQIKLKPNKAQEIFFNKSCGVARFAYNWALRTWEEGYKKGEKQSAYTVIKHLNSIKKDQFPWMQEVGKCASQYPIHDLEFAYKKMWREGKGYPKNKKKGVKDSFVAIESKAQYKGIKNSRIGIPRLGWVKCHENLRFEGKVNNVVIKRIADMWFAYINIEVTNSTPTLKPKEGDNQAIVGVDLGIKSMMVLSDGTVFENPKALRNNLKSLKRLQRGLTRKVKGSKNRKKQQMKLARKHYRVACIRKNAIHQATAIIVKKYDKIVMETLRPANMVKCHNIAQSIKDASFGAISRQLAYKASWANRELVKASQWFPSTKMCSNCGSIKNDLTLSQRTYNCEKCGLSIDRDLNAAINLANYSPTSKFEGSEACGESSEPRKVQRTSKKQELSNLTTVKI